jgi:16S rRNA (adenine1518-N6/adenine1519-N6)-dimethyltransferase
MVVLVKPKKSLGQNFLIDKNIARKIVKLIDISPEDFVVEIGPGYGILTHFFCNTPATFICSEIDSRLVENLQTEFKSFDNISIIHQDFLSFDLGSINRKSKTLKWVGNLPYNITSSVLFLMIHNYPLVKKAVFMVQKEVAERIVASIGSKNYGILAVLLQTFYQVKYGFSVSPQVFRPKPRVDSAVITFDIRSDFYLNCERTFYERLVKTAFNQRRKQLKNALQKVIDRDKMDQIPFDFNRRAEEVSIEDWKKLCQFLEKKKHLIQAMSG